MSIEENIEEFHSFLADKNCRLVAVSKTKPIVAIKKAYNAGQRDFGENKVQELRDKEPILPSDIRWHMIGHLQSNKVKYIAPYIHLIHSIDSMKLLAEVDKQALKNERVIDCLLQVHIAEEETKFGFNKEELEDLLGSEEFSALQSIKIVGLMGMATFTENQDQIQKEFRVLKNLFDHLSQNYTRSNTHWKEISMGMSGDYEIAIEEGSTLIRVGSSIFGERNY
jgi:pyridoxal phosphate enzyme (YggS family)